MRQREKIIIVLCCAAMTVLVFINFGKMTAAYRYSILKYIQNDDYTPNNEVNLILNSHPYNLLVDLDIEGQTLEGQSNSLTTIPYFWHIHKNGGTSMKNIFSCLQKIQTGRSNREGVCEDSDTMLKVCELQFGSLGRKVINVDASSFQGIQRGIDLGMTQKGSINGLIDASGNEETFIVVSSRFYDALSLFTPERQARLFLVLRHPVQRVISKYFYMKKATWERSYTESVSNMSLMEYASSKHCYSNWITRRLVNKMQGDLNDYDLILAKEILRRKALILLLDDLPHSVERLRIYFGWQHEVLSDDQKFCLNKFIKDEPANVNQDKEYVSPDSLEWNIIKEKNMMDIELMAFALQLYKEQGIKMNL